MTNFQKMLAFMREQLGKLYDIGDHGPDLWDCSGIIMEAIKKVMGWIWSHSSHYQYYDNIKPGGKFTEYGELATMPKDKGCLLFKYGERTSGKGKGMVHVGAYDGKTKTELQAGGHGPIVNLEVYRKNIESGMTPIDAVNNSLAKNHPGGTRKSVVWEQAFNKGHWTHWGHGAWMDEEYSENAPEIPAEPQESPCQTLRKGDGFPDVVKGEHVKTLQNLLNQRGAKLKVDGKFGTLTYQAVRDYQEEKGLFVDGVVGPITWGVLTAEIQPDEPSEDEEPQELVSLLLSGLTSEQADEVIALAGRYPGATVEQME
jgi:hypothetical protein